MVIFCYPAGQLDSHGVRGKRKAGKVFLSDKLRTVFCNLEGVNDRFYFIDGLLYRCLRNEGFPTGMWKNYTIWQSGLGKQITHTRKGIERSYTLMRQKTADQFN